MFLFTTLSMLIMTVSTVNIHFSENKMVEYLSYDMILHGKDGNIVFNDDWYSDGMQDWVVMALPQLMGTVMLFPKFRTYTKHITFS